MQESAPNSKNMRGRKTSNSANVEARELIADIRHAAREVVAEALWPTRCALCDAPGKPLCDGCESQLRYLDQWQACRRCGAPFGRIVCTECNSFALKRLGRASLPYRTCTSATIFTPETGTVIRTFKDSGERELATAIARLMARSIPPDWPIDAIAFVPATRNAVRRRGFDHGLLLAKELARIEGKPFIRALEAPKTIDQRGLSREERIANLAGSFIATEESRKMALTAPSVLLIDDVYTTGSTLCTAADALLEGGYKEIRCASFARVY